MLRGMLPIAVALVSLLGQGCQHRPPSASNSEPPVVPVSQPVRRDVADFVDYTGRVDAVQSLDVRARVTGYLEKLPFKEGSEVKAGDLLFEIDPRPYQASYDASKAQVALQEANYRYYKATNARNHVLLAGGGGAISQQEVEQGQAQEEQALASLAVAKANLASAKLNLDFTKVTSPIDGQVSRYYLTLGNLVSQNSTLLTTVVSLDPMYVYFDMDERTVIRIRQMINSGKIQIPQDSTQIPVLVALEGEEGYPHQGTLDFVNNTVNPSTGTIAVRAVVANPKPNNGRRLFSPGMFVRVRLPLGQPQPALLVIDRALGSDQGLKFVYVVNAENKIEYRRVTTGALQEDGLRVIEKGVAPEDRVVVGGLQQVRPRMTVNPDLTPMPSVTGPESSRNKPQPPPAGENAAAGPKQPTPASTGKGQ
jgi:multidrug efflux system membrane fusion protein